jgi:hypothetical protein
MAKYTVSFKVEIDDSLATSTQLLEFDIKDLITTAVLPTLGLSLVPVTFEVKKAR